MCKVVLVLVWLKEVKEVVVVTVETDCHLAPEMVVVTVVTDCHLCLERPVSRVVDGGTPMRHRKTACFEALVLEPHFAQSCARFLLLYCILGWQSSLQASFHWKTQNVKLPVCPTPADCICSNSGAIFSAGQ